MSSHHIAELSFRGILESRGQPTVEAEVRLADGRAALASAPVAIAPGRRESAHGAVARLGGLSSVAPYLQLVRELQGRGFASLAELDAWLEGSAAAERVGAGARLATSVAFCRALALSRGQAVWELLRDNSGRAPGLPRLLVNVFSGGIHAMEAAPFQQIMLVPRSGKLRTDVEAALEIYARIERRIAREVGHVQLSASSGMLVLGRDYRALLGTVAEEIAASGHDATLGVDVAAEHLKRGAHYQFGGEQLAPDALCDRLLELSSAFGIEFVEDPFDADDTAQWRRFTASVAGGTQVVGDDLFATNARYLDRELANAILLKPSQIGTLSGTLRTASAAAAQGLSLCVSHRSGETEDQVVCHLAVALGAAFIKIGGPRRGDRTARYNELLRLSERWPDRPDHTVTPRASKPIVRTNAADPIGGA